MTKYRLLKYIEKEWSIKIWETFDIDKKYVTLDNDWQIDVDFLIREWYIEEIIEKPKLLKNLNIWDKVYYITENKINDYMFNNSFLEDIDDYPTYEQAERELKFRQAKRKIEDWILENDNWVIDWNNKIQYKYFIYYDNDFKQLLKWNHNINKFALFYFSSEDICEKAIKELAEKFIYILKDY